MNNASLLDRRLLVHDNESISMVDAALEKAELSGVDTPGIQDADAREAFCQQLIESIRRVQFVRRIPTMNLSPNRKDPESLIFDPLRAASIFNQTGSIDEAGWLSFLSTHFGQRPDTKWSLVREFYRGDEHGHWTWSRASADVPSLLLWLDTNKDALRAAGRFGNHRKYESLEAYGTKGTGAALSSYIDWVSSYGGHAGLFSHAQAQASGNSELAFAWLYDALDNVVRFGRMAKFDFLCTLGKLNIAYVSPGSMFVAQSTGPLRGGKALFGNEKSAKDIESAVRAIDSQMGVGMQVFEDAICNWQKSTHKFVAFRG